MDREKLIRYGKDYLSDLITACCEISDIHKEFVSEAVKALEQEPCEDAVSRSEIQQKINRLWNSNGDKDYCMETLKDFVTDLPPITPTQRWIPVSERLPKKNDGYLVTVKQGYVTTALWCGVSKYWVNVTAWMPLPYDYKEGVEE